VEPAPPRSLARPSRGEPTVDYSFDQRADSQPSAFRPGDLVSNPTFGDGVVVACDAGGSDAKATVRFFSIGEKRVVARFLTRAG
jgi:DNA helicase-2/ATP-dependent DNA helicase PcrA